MNLLENFFLISEELLSRNFRLIIMEKTYNNTDKVPRFFEVIISPMWVKQKVI